MTPNEVIYQRAHEIVDHDTDIINILKTLQKLKAALEAVISNNPNLIQKKPIDIH